jgi:hypothetical protein
MFRSEGRMHVASSRAMNVAKVSENLRVARRRSGDQHGVWTRIDDLAVRAQAYSETAAMRDVYLARDRDLARVRSALRPLPGQVGAVFAIGGRVRGLELADCPQSWAGIAQRVADSYAFDALVASGMDAGLAGGAGTATPRGDGGVAAFLAALRSADVAEHPALGEGVDLRLGGQGVTGAALLARGRIVHCCAFATDAD